MTRQTQQQIWLAATHALTETYGQDFSTRCLQSSVVVQALLNELGMASRLIVGQVRVRLTKRHDPRRKAWFSFGDQGHHVWLCTALNETVDLAISRVHLHPLCRGKAFEPVPPIWCPTPRRWPVNLRYTAKGLGADQLDPQEHDVMQRTVYHALQRLHQLRS